MAADALAQPELPGFAPTLPVHGWCLTCRAPVITAVLNGEVVVADAGELLETFPCPQCQQVASKGHRSRGLCRRCRGAGVIGGPLPLRGLLVDYERGEVARRFTRSRREGEAVYRLHRCA